MDLEYLNRDLKLKKIILIQARDILHAIWSKDIFEQWITAFFLPNSWFKKWCGLPGSSAGGAAQEEQHRRSSWERSRRKQKEAEWSSTKQNETEWSRIFCWNIWSYVYLCMYHIVKEAPSVPKTNSGHSPLWWPTKAILRWVISLLALN